jgi:hypothetical protein
MASAECALIRLTGSFGSLPFDFDSFLRSGSVTKPEMAAFFHGISSCSRCVEEPRADDVVGLRAQVVGEDLPEQLGIVSPAADDLGRQRRRRPRVHDVRIPGEPAGLVALIGGVAVGDTGVRVERELVAGRDDRRLPLDLTVGGDRVPERDRDAEGQLAGDVPVAVQAVDPVLEPDPHEVGPPLELLAPLKQCFAELGIAAPVADEPLAVGDDLEREVAVLPELDRMLDRTRVADQVA